jgi:hypothetical protein
LYVPCKHFLNNILHGSYNSVRDFNNSNINFTLNWSRRTASDVWWNATKTTLGTALIQWNNSHPQNYSESLLRSNWVHPRYLMGVTRSLALCVMFCRSLFVLWFFFIWLLCCLSFFFWSLCCLSFDLRILISPLDRAVFHIPCKDACIGAAFVSVYVAIFSLMSFPVRLCGSSCWILYSGDS